MLKKSQRLTRTDFTTYSKAGKRFHSEYASLIWHTHDTFHGAVVVSKKVSKHAVVRNTIRRRVYSLLYTQKTNSHQGVWIVIIKPPYAQLTKHQARTQIQLLIERAAKPA